MILRTVIRQKRSLFPNLLQRRDQRADLQKKFLSSLQDTAQDRKFLIKLLEQTRSFMKFEKF